METMGRTKRPRRSFTKEFKAEVVGLVRQPAATVASVARDLDLTETAVRAWVKQAAIDDGQREGLTSAQLDDSHSYARRTGIEVFYNRQRLHSAIGYCPPAEHEAKLHHHTTAEAA